MSRDSNLLADKNVGKKVDLYLCCLYSVGLLDPLIKHKAAQRQTSLTELWCWARPGCNDAGNAFILQFEIFCQFSSLL